MKRSERVAEQVRACTACPLHRNLLRPVPMRGARGGLVVVGEAPGKDEAKRGRPFVGRAGRLLDKMLVASGIDLEKVGYLNTVCCLPLTDPKEGGKVPVIRPPYPDEQWACRHNWIAQMRWLRPKYVLTVGATPLNLLRPDLRVTKVAGVVLSRAWRRLVDPWEGRWVGRIVPVVVTYHPAWVLRSGGLEGDGARLVMRHIRKLVRIMAVGDAYWERDERCARCGNEEVEKCDGDGLYWCHDHATGHP